MNITLSTLRPRRAWRGAAIRAVRATRQARAGRQGRDEDGGVGAVAVNQRARTQGRIRRPRKGRERGRRR